MHSRHRNNRKPMGGEKARFPKKLRMLSKPLL